MSEDKPAEQLKDDPTLLEIYDRWQSSLEDALWEVRQLRNFLDNLRQSEFTCNVHVTVAPPTLPYSNTSSSITYSTVSIPHLHYPVAGQMPIADKLASIPQNTQVWHDGIRRKMYGVGSSRADHHQVWGSQEGQRSKCLIYLRNGNSC